MVEAMELRIGNWYVLAKPELGSRIPRGEYIQLNQLHFAGAQEDGYELQSLLWPIQLSDRIIAEAGFVNGKLNGLRLISNGPDAPGYSLYYGETWLCHVVDLHQLQNLVAGLESKELQIQL